MMNWKGGVTTLGSGMKFRFWHKIRHAGVRCEDAASHAYSE